MVLEEEAKTLALKWWKEYFSGVVPDPALLPGKLGFRLHELPELADKKLDGMCKRAGDGVIDIYLNPAMDGRRRNITIGHECAHPILHPGQADFYCKLRSPGSERDIREWQATRCGCHFIMPEPLLLRTVYCIRATQAQAHPSANFDEQDPYGPNALAKWALTILFNTFPASWTAIKRHLAIMNIQSFSLTQKFLNENIRFPWEAGLNQKRGSNDALTAVHITPYKMNELYRHVLKTAI
jgi:hypothetical protein